MFDFNAAQAVMKETYADGVVPIDYRESKTLAIIKKNKGTLVQSPYGAHFNVPVLHGNPQAGSGTYADAYSLAPSNSSQTSSWAVDPGTFWHFADVGGDLVRRGEGAGSFVDAMTFEVENAKKAMRRMFEIMLFRGGYGDLARFNASTPSSTTATLQFPWMVRFIEKKMNVVFASSEDSAVLRSDTAIEVTGRSVSAGTLTFAAAPSTVGGAASDFIFRKGDRQNSATPSRIIPRGFKAWLPTSAPSSTLFFNVNRTVDDRLGGLRHNATDSASVEEALMDAEALIDAEGGKCTHFVMGRNTFNKLAKSMSNRIEYAEIETDMGIGIPGFRMKGSDAIVYWDTACEETISYGFNIEEIEIRYAGESLFMVDQTDGLFFREVPGVDAWRCKMVNTSQLILPAPGHAVVLYNL